MVALNDDGDDARRRRTQIRWTEVGIGLLRQSQGNGQDDTDKTQARRVALLRYPFRDSGGVFVAPALLSAAPQDPGPRNCHVDLHESDRRLETCAVGYRQDELLPAPAIILNRGFGVKTNHSCELLPTELLNHAGFAAVNFSMEF
jgi:hypothetical protein